jgi:hypothetical protein
LKARNHTSKTEGIFDATQMALSIIPALYITVLLFAE